MIVNANELAFIWALHLKRFGDLLNRFYSLAIGIQIFVSRGLHSVSLFLFFKFITSVKARLNACVIQYIFL